MNELTGGSRATNRAVVSEKVCLPNVPETLAYLSTALTLFRCITFNLSYESCGVKNGGQAR